uniref:Serine/arginine-rich splicing factor SR45a n=1 Tax=Macrostomum lignano TaxID=282301 RepID=A0A1I8HA11_9PLAT
QSARERLCRPTHRPLTDIKTGVAQASSAGNFHLNEKEKRVAASTEITESAAVPAQYGNGFQRNRGCSGRRTEHERAGDRRSHHGRPRRNHAAAGLVHGQHQLSRGPPGPGAPPHPRLSSSRSCQPEAGEEGGRIGGVVSSRRQRVVICGVHVEQRRVVQRNHGSQPAGGRHQHGVADGATAGSVCETGSAPGSAPARAQQNRRRAALVSLHPRVRTRVHRQPAEHRGRAGRQRHLGALVGVRSRSRPGADLLPVQEGSDRHHPRTGVLSRSIQIDARFSCRL